ncbi:MAG: hypothetical protein ACOZAJ_03320 [Patescibacteria group bacterium]
MSKDQIFTASAIVLLLFVAFVDWSVISWLVLAAIILLLAAWYKRGRF